MSLKKYDEIYEIVGKYDLIGIAFVSDDEYEPEVIDITNRAVVLPEDRLAEYIKEVFSFWFGKELIPDNPEIYTNMAKEIKALVA